MMSFNEYRYEIFVSEAFALKGQKKPKEADFHFLMYIKYVVYDWIQTICCCQLNWEDCQRIEMAREEANEQIDVKSLLSRIAHLEQLNKHQISTSLDFCTLITKDNSIQELKAKRNIIDYYNKIVSNSSALTMRELATGELVEDGSEINLVSMKFHNP